MTSIGDIREPCFNLLALLLKKALPQAFFCLLYSSPNHKVMCHPKPHQLQSLTHSQPCLSNEAETAKSGTLYSSSETVYMTALVEFVLSCQGAEFRSKYV